MSFVQLLSIMSVDMWNQFAQKLLKAHISKIYKWMIRYDRPNIIPLTLDKYIDKSLCPFCSSPVKQTDLEGLWD